MDHFRWMVVLCFLSTRLQGVTMLRLVDLKVPQYTISGQPVQLECHYDLQGEALYSVKWFKNDQEFFRFLPEDDPPAHVFSQDGMHVDLSKSSDTAVLFKVVNSNSTGNYRCEVSGEAPSFKTVTVQKPMMVVDLPDATGPQIHGVQRRYRVGDVVRVNCTSSRSRPAAKLFWYINQEPAEEDYLLQYPISIDEDGMQTSLLGLKFKVRVKHLKKGDLKLKCLATIDTIYWRSNEQSVGDRLKKTPILESRGPHSHTQGVSSRASGSLETSNIPSIAVVILFLCFFEIIITSINIVTTATVKQKDSHQCLPLPHFYYNA